MPIMPIGFLVDWLGTRQYTSFSTEKTQSFVLFLISVASTLEKKERKILVRNIDQALADRKMARLRHVFETTFRDNWKDVLLGSTHRMELNIFHPFIDYSNVGSRPIQWKERSKIYERKHSAAAFGSSFCTNLSHRIDAKGNALLDAGVLSTCYDPWGNFTGFALAIADGAGGHFGDDHQDAQIALASHFITEGFVRYLSESHNPKQISVENTIKDVQEDLKAANLLESATVVFCRAFLSQTNYRIVGATIGDSMAFAWHPDSQTFFNIAPSHVSLIESGDKKFVTAATAAFPGFYKPEEVHSFDCVVPNGTFLFLATDGLHDGLPLHEVKKCYPSGLSYQIRTLESDKVKQILSRGSPKDYLKALGEASFQHLEKERQKRASDPQLKIGDDVGIICCSLAAHSRSSKNETALLIDFSENPDLSQVIKQPKKKIILKHCKLNLLAKVFPYLPENLDSLSFQECPSLTLKVLGEIPKRYCQLKELRIERCEKLKRFEIPPTLWGKGSPLELPKLEVLSLEQQLFNSVRLKAPSTALIEGTFLLEDPQIDLNRAYDYVLFKLYLASFQCWSQGKPFWAKRVESMWAGLTFEAKQELTLEQLEGRGLPNSTTLCKEDLRRLEAILPTLPPIRTLSLSGLDFNKELLKRVPNSLERLDLSFMLLSKEGMKTLTQILISQFPNLKYLDLRGCKIEQEMESVLQLIQSISSLESLNISAQWWGKESVARAKEAASKHKVEVFIDSAT